MAAYSAFHKTFDRRFAKFVVNFISSLWTWEFQYVTVNQMANFQTNLGISHWTLWECGEEMSPLLSVVVLKWVPSSCKERQFQVVWEKIIKSWLEWKGPSQIGQKMRLPKEPLPKLLIFSFAEGISKTTNEEISLDQRVLNDVNNYMECCKTTCTTPAFTTVKSKTNW